MTRKPFFILPPNTLKMKVGDGGIPAYIIKRCQDYIDSNPVDLAPYAARNLEQIKDLHSKISRGMIDDVTGLEVITNTVMQLKSNGSMFHYQLVSMISDVMLRFLGNLTHINADTLDIIAMYARVLDVILNKQLTGNGGKEGYALTQELHNACQRYELKYPPKTPIS